MKQGTQEQVVAPKDERADKTKEGLGMQEQKSQLLIFLPSAVL